VSPQNSARAERFRWFIAWVASALSSSSVETGRSAAVSTISSKIDCAKPGGWGSARFVRQQYLYFLPLPQGHKSFLPVFTQLILIFCPLIRAGECDLTLGRPGIITSIRFNRRQKCND
jgi:hypothetical protein